MRRAFLIATAVTTAGFVLFGLLSFGLLAAARAGDVLTKKQFLEAANATCEDAYQAIDAALEEQFAGLGENAEPSAAQIEAGVASIVEILRTAAAEVKALVGPPALERKVKRFLRQFRAVVGKFVADPQAAFAEELSGYPFAKPDRLARKIGLDACVQRND
jgi:hypothetical protein